MKLRELLDKWILHGLKIHLGFLQADFKPNEVDRDAAELRQELATLKVVLGQYTGLLSDVAGVENLAQFENA